MAIGAQDYIDQLLVKKYAQEQVDNHNPIESMVQPEKMLGAMNDFADASRTMVALSQKLATICYSVNAANARYRKASSPQMS